MRLRCLILLVPRVLDRPEVLNQCSEFFFLHSKNLLEDHLKPCQNVLIS